MAPSPQTLSVDDRRPLAAWAADRAQHVLAIFEVAVPGGCDLSRHPYRC